MIKKWGIDIDGVLADFESAMQPLVVNVSGKSRFTVPLHLRTQESISGFLRSLGYSKADIDAAWAMEHRDEFWQDIEPLQPNMIAFNRVLHNTLVPRGDEIYFVTARRGIKDSTELWLTDHTGVYNPTVLLTPDKGTVARGLALDVFVDDRLEQALAVRLESIATRVYLLDKPYNAYNAIDGITRVKSLSEVFAAEEDIDLANAATQDPLDVLE